MARDTKKIIYSALPALLLVIIMWAVKLYEVTSGYYLYRFGLLPHSIEHLTGILFYPFIHGDLEHLYSNTIPFLILGAGMVFFYGKLSFRVFLLIFFLSGIGLWIGGRQTFHIGASGLVYGMASFLFFSGVLRRDVRLMAISLIVTFLYGSMVWGVFPIVQGVSWEGHLFGALSGLVAAFGFRKDGPQKPKYMWEIEEEMQEEMQKEEKKYWEEFYDRDPANKDRPSPPTNINYVYKPKENDSSDERKKD
ncbi:MAG: rhomboid family intramembrane serine protease [Bacteroidia bacterium]|nr:rhomboid family intramembrane serine protease [Bacteroidia bacterium]